MAEFEVRDIRVSSFFWADNSAIDNYISKIGSVAFCVYMILCRYADNKTGECSPSQERLATMCGVTDRTIRTAIGTLENNKLIDVQRTTIQGRRDRNVYRLLSIGDRKPASYRPEMTTGSATGNPLPINNTEQDLEKDLVLSPPSSEHKPSKKKESDPRYVEFIEALSAGYKRKGWEFAFGVKDGAQLKSLLKSRPNWDKATFLRCLKNYFSSEKVVQGDMPYVYLSRLPRYLNGPLNEFGKMLKSEVSYAEDTTYHA